MHRYRVVHRVEGDERVALRDLHGRYHLARALKSPPPLRVVLKGTRPHLGFGLLTCEESGESFRLIFERINDVSLVIDG